MNQSKFLIYYFIVSHFLFFMYIKTHKSVINKIINKTLFSFFFNFIYSGVRPEKRKPIGVRFCPKCRKLFHDVTFFRRHRCMKKKQNEEIYLKITL